MPVKMLEIPVHQARVLLCSTKADAGLVLATWYPDDDKELEDAIAVLTLSGASSFEADSKGKYHLLYAPRTPVHVSHEAVHISLFILEALGVAATSDNSEPQAYLVDHIVGAYFERKGWIAVETFLKKKQGKKRGKN